MGKVKTERITRSKQSNSTQSIKNLSKIKFNPLKENINVSFMMCKSNKESIEFQVAS